MSDQDDHENQRHSRDQQGHDDQQGEVKATGEPSAQPEAPRFTHATLVESYVEAGLITRTVNKYGDVEYGRGPEADDAQWVSALKSLVLALTGTGLGRGLVGVELASGAGSGAGDGSVWLMRTKWPDGDPPSVNDLRGAGDSPLDLAMAKMAASLRGAKLAAVLDPDEPARLTGVGQGGVIGENARASGGYVRPSGERVSTSGWPDFVEAESENGPRSDFGEDAGVDILPGDHRDYSDEQVEPFPPFIREPIPHEEQTRRGMLIGLGIGFVALFLIQLGLALVLNEDDWARVGPTLTSASTLISAGIGYALGHYFSGKK